MMASKSRMAGLLRVPTPSPPVFRGPCKWVDCPDTRGSHVLCRPAPSLLHTCSPSSWQHPCSQTIQFEEMKKLLGDTLEKGIVRAWCYVAMRTWVHASLVTTFPLYVLYLLCCFPQKHESR